MLYTLKNGAGKSIEGSLVSYPYFSSAQLKTGGTVRFREGRA